MDLARAKLLIEQERRRAEDQALAFYQHVRESGPHPFGDAEELREQARDINDDGLAKTEIEAQELHRLAGSLERDEPHTIGPLRQPDFEMTEEDQLELATRLEGELTERQRREAERADAALQQNDPNRDRAQRLAQMLDRMERAQSRDRENERER